MEIHPLRVKSATQLSWQLLSKAQTLEQGCGLQPYSDSDTRYRAWDAEFGMPNVRCWIQVLSAEFVLQGWDVRPCAARTKGASERPGSWCREAWCREAMRRCWEGVGGTEHPSTRQFHCCLPLPAVGALALPDLQNEMWVSALVLSSIL